MTANDIKNALESAGISASAFERIRLARGVVGKASYVAAAAVIGLGVVAFALRDPLFLFLDAILIVVLFSVYFTGVIWFSHRHPGVALLEGAELIQWQQMEMAAKNMPTLPEGKNITPLPLVTDGGED